MPDEAATATEPTVETPATEAPAAAEPSASSDAIYDTAFTETMTTTPAAEKPAETVAPVVEAPKVETPSGPVLTDGVKQILSRAGLKEDFITGWDQAKVDSFAGYLAKTQAEQDKLGAELGRLKQTPEPKQAPKEEPKTPESQWSQQHRAKYIEDYGDEAAPLLDRLDRFETENAQLREQASAIEPMAALVTDLLVDMGLSALEKDYPSIAKPDARKQVEDRFWLEWNTGAYAKPNTTLRQQLQMALASAAKVTFMNTTEQTAAVSLANANKAKLASQPKIGNSAPVKRAPATTDDVYDAAFAETMGAGR